MHQRGDPGICPPLPGITLAVCVIVEIAGYHTSPRMEYSQDLIISAK
jgi:hypothetical protein